MHGYRLFASPGARRVAAVAVAESEVLDCDGFGLRGATRHGGEEKWR
jgi:hypothetical protein